MKRRIALITLALLPIFACAQGEKSPATPPATQAPDAQSAPGKAPRVRFKTTKGEFVVELNAEKAPVTVKNFLSYAKKKHYDGTVFHRIIFGFMIQGGGFAVDGTKLVEKATGMGIANESNNGLTNQRGSIAMARTRDPNSATAQFFINVADNAGLNYPSNGGYAVFGKVVSGMEVVDKIRAVATGNRELTMRNPATGETLTQASPDVPGENVVIQSVSVE